jgi:predicted nucleotidyltransferase
LQRVIRGCLEGSCSIDCERNAFDDPVTRFPGTSICRANSAAEMSSSLSSSEKMLAGVNRGARAMVCLMHLLVVINDLHISRAGRSAGLHFDRGSSRRIENGSLEFGVATRLWYRIAMKRDEAISRLKQHEADLKRLGVEHLYIFGSTARGEAKDDSDVDLFFDYEKGKLGLFELMDVKEYAANILGRETDIMTRDSLHKTLRQQIEETATRVF